MFLEISWNFPDMPTEKFIKISGGKSTRTLNPRIKRKKHTKWFQILVFTTKDKYL